MSEFRLRQEQLVAERLGQMPKSYRATYRKAVAGNSLRAAVNSFCLECVGWRVEEIRHCTDLGCPLYAVRPYQGSSQKGDDGGLSERERPNAVSLTASTPQTELSQQNSLDGGFDTNSTGPEL